MIICKPNEIVRLPISVEPPTSITHVTLVRDIYDPIHVEASALTEYMVEITIPSGTTAGLYDWFYGQNKGVLEVEIDDDELIEYDDGVIYDEQYVVNELINDDVTNLSQTWSSQKITDKLSELQQDTLNNHYTKSQTNALLNDKADKLTTYTKMQVDGYLSGKADKSDTYTKAQTYSQAQVNALLSATTYTKLEVNSLLLQKADANNVYTKSQIDNTVNNLNVAISTKADASNVYTKAQTYNKSEVDTAIAAIATFEAVVVSALPQTGEAKKMYFVKKNVGQTGATNVYEEYLWVRDLVGTGYHYELIGETGVDMSQYYTKSETYSKTEVNTYLAGKQATLISGTNIKTIGGQSLLGSGNIQAVTIDGNDYDETLSGTTSTAITTP